MIFDFFFLENDARNLWKNLRQEFGKQLKKIQGRSGDAASDENESHWPYFHKLQFLRDQFTPRRMSSSLIDRPNEILTQDTLDVNSEVSGESDGDHSTVSSLPNVLSPLSESQTGDSVPTSIPSTSGSKYSVTQTGYKKRITAQVEIGKQLVDLEKEKLALKVNKIKQDLNDEDIGFFNSLLPHVRKLSPRDKLKFRMKTQETLFDLLFPPASPTPVEHIHQTHLNLPSTSHLSHNHYIYNNSIEAIETNSDANNTNKSYTIL